MFGSLASIIILLLMGQPILTIIGSFLVVIIVLKLFAGKMYSRIIGGIIFTIGTVVFLVLSKSTDKTSHIVYEYAYAFSVVGAFLDILIYKRVDLKKKILMYYPFGIIILLIVFGIAILAKTTNLSSNKNIVGFIILIIYRISDGLAITGSSICIKNEKVFLKGLFMAAIALIVNKLIWKDYNEFYLYAFPLASLMGAYLLLNNTDVRLGRWGYFFIVSILIFACTYSKHSTFSLILVLPFMAAGIFDVYALFTKKRKYKNKTLLDFAKLKGMSEEKINKWYLIIMFTLSSIYVLSSLSNFI